ncbi:Lrp/AsnC ligand binding domain-containing protein [Polycladidibacter stylochi]|uniref:Lrp/AsnC ligand binding domain-containing protein n=1 Tax=Polycladidibacter stylochi TaxID=1807766 RepID=UPI000832DBE0|nr:Lrp/AsnC ligand binding domain-containing protein [Pseudovibrio stylochi]
MTPFFIMIKCELGKTYKVADMISAAEIASEVYSTSGDYDLLVKVYVENQQDIGHFIAENIHNIEGIKDTKTIITFKAF